MSMTRTNRVSQAVIDSLGGIEDTIKPMQNTLKKHELRPFDYLRDYATEIKSLKSGKGQPIGEPEMESMNIISASPYRATIKVDTPIKSAFNKHAEDDQNSEEDDFARSGTLNDPPMTFLSTFNKDRESPIKDDSTVMREKGDDYLQNMVRAKSPSIKLGGGTDRSANLKSPLIR